MTNFPEKWDKERRKQNNEPSGRFYAFCYGLAFGCVAGILTTIWALTVG